MQASVREQRHVVFMSLQPLCCFCCLSYFVSICSAKKVEEDTGDYHVDRVSTDFSRALAQARRNKGMTQAQLAQAINEKPSVVSEYESGKAIPNGVILQKMSRALGVQLPKCKQKKRVADE
ncbi:multiprotein bridging factor type 1, putative [Eimeria maxima]|uniref:Multiprotein bridging factor type 1, putative n=1 Tax=Eimeria maxima TaxID=5804 RepID=U6MA74_EIMMA|nr:multiprotein bridging factor type 1, putative [Eimeria maxima]CDJ58525.1 multiprotein bridging factor type 1, putative [Eimeria maxima]